MPLTSAGWSGSRARVQRISLDYTKWYVNVKLLYTFLLFLFVVFVADVRFRLVSVVCVWACVWEPARARSLIMRCVVLCDWVCCACAAGVDRWWWRKVAALNAILLALVFLHLSRQNSSRPRTITYITITIRRSALLTSLLKFLLWCIVNAKRINF